MKRRDTMPNESVEATATSFGFGEGALRAECPIRCGRSVSVAVPHLSRSGCHVTTVVPSEREISPRRSVLGSRSRLTGRDSLTLRVRSGSTPVVDARPSSRLDSVNRFDFPNQPLEATATRSPMRCRTSSGGLGVTGVCASAHRWLNGRTTI